jgi:beta-aspartyl-peptidase (threonine type)
MNKILLAIHGGAGVIRQGILGPEQEAAYHQALESALKAGYVILEKGGTALDAVTAAVASLEDCPLFNAGRGSVFTHEGRHEMDACVMEGKGLAAGAVAGVNGIRNPVKAARAVMEHSEHVLLAGEGAVAFARTQELAFEEEAWFHSDFRYAQWQEALKEDRVRLDHSEKKFGTVGAVACDLHGNLSAATSTGGMTNKRWGRIGDSPVPGAGTYANNAGCAVSCTGHGEFFLRGVVAYDVHCLMEYRGWTLQQAAEEVILKKQVSLGGEGGLIAVDAAGNAALVFNSEGMYRGVMRATGLETAIYGA